MTGGNQQRVTATLPELDKETVQDLAAEKDQDVKDGGYPGREQG